MAVRILNESRGTELAAAAERADSPLRRMRGLLGRRGLPEGGGLILTPAGSIHMFFMRFPIDAVFVDRENTVVKAVSDLRPWRLAAARRSRSCIELPAGTIARTGTAPGDILRFEPTGS